MKYLRYETPYFESGAGLDPYGLRWTMILRQVERIVRSLRETEQDHGLFAVYTSLLTKEDSYKDRVEAHHELVKLAKGVVSLSYRYGLYSILQGRRGPEEFIEDHLPDLELLYGILTPTKQLVAQIHFETFNALERSYGIIPHEPRQAGYLKVESQLESFYLAEDDEYEKLQGYLDTYSEYLHSQEHMNRRARFLQTHPEVKLPTARELQRLENRLNAFVLLEG